MPLRTPEITHDELAAAAESGQDALQRLLQGPPERPIPRQEQIRRAQRMQEIVDQLDISEEKKRLIRNVTHTILQRYRAEMENGGPAGAGQPAARPERPSIVRRVWNAIKYPFIVGGAILLGGLLLSGNRTTPSSRPTPTLTPTPAPQPIPVPAREPQRTDGPPQDVRTEQAGGSGFFGFLARPMPVATRQPVETAVPVTPVQPEQAEAPTVMLATVNPGPQHESPQWRAAGVRTHVAAQRFFADRTNAQLWQQGKDAIQAERRFLQDVVNRGGAATGMVLTANWFFARDLYLSVLETEMEDAHRAALGQEYSSPTLPGLQAMTASALIAFNQEATRQSVRAAQQAIAAEIEQFYLAGLPRRSRSAIAHRFRDLLVLQRQVCLRTYDDGDWRQRMEGTDEACLRFYVEPSQENFDAAQRRIREEDLIFPIRRGENEMNREAVDNRRGSILSRMSRGNAALFAREQIRIP